MTGVSALLEVLAELLEELQRLGEEFLAKAGEVGAVANVEVLVHGLAKQADGFDGQVGARLGPHEHPLLARACDADHDRRDDRGDGDRDQDQQGGHGCGSVSADPPCETVAP